MGLFDAMYSTSAFGVAAEFTPKGGVADSVTVMINEDPDLGDASGNVGHTAKIQVRQSEVATRPPYRSTFEIASGANAGTWTIINDGVQELAAVGVMNGEWLCHCSKTERMPI